MRALTLLLTTLLFLIIACSRADEFKLGTVDEITSFVENNQSGYVYIITDEDYLNPISELAKKYDISILTYNIYKPDGKTEQKQITPT